MALSDDVYFRVICDPGHERTSRELQQLARSEREKVWADMAGKKTPPEGPESVGFMCDLLGQFHIELKESPSKIKGAYLRAADQNLIYVHSPIFWRMFLRAEDYDPRRAVRRYLFYFKQKEYNFGPESLARNIRLEDLDDDDMESLRSGAIQLLPRKDHAGRIVVVGQARHLKYKKRENLIRALHYQLMSTFLEDEEAQHCGLVCIGYEVGAWVKIDHELTRQIIRCLRGLPIRVAAVHTCYSASAMYSVFDLLVHMLAPFTRLRMRIHNGSSQECLYRLQCVGVPVQLMPIDEDGELKKENFKNWLSYRSQKEAEFSDDIDASEYSSDEDF